MGERIMILNENTSKLDRFVDVRDEQTFRVKGCDYHVFMESLSVITFCLQPCPQPSMHFGVDNDPSNIDVALGFPFEPSKEAKCSNEVINDNDQNLDEITMCLLTKRLMW